MNQYIDNISELNISNEIKIITLSDIHGDIQSLIIALRDCGNVIKKKEGFSFNNKTIDSNLDELLLIDISSNDYNYTDDLNYEWCGNDTHIVIVGDFLDAKRENNDITVKKNIIISISGKFKTIEEKNYGMNEYPQIEIKLFKFLNSLNKQAKKYGGRIIKMFGNHEIYNILSDNYQNFIRRYGYNETFLVKNYYKQQNRFDSFKIGGEGYKLLIEDGIYLLFKINNNLFIHGELINKHSEKPYLNKMTFEDYNYINYIINFDSNLLYSSNIIKNIIINNLITIYNTIGIDNDSPLWQRTFGSSDLIESRIKDNDLFCKNIKNIFHTLKGNNLFNDNIDDLRIIIGHCPQYFSTVYNQPNTTFSHVIEQDEIKEILGPQLEIIKDTTYLPNKLTIKDEHYKKYYELSGLKEQIKKNESPGDLYEDHFNDDFFKQSYTIDNTKLIDKTKYDIKHRGYANLDKQIVFGISMECDKDKDASDSHIYKVDVGSSRGFDDSQLLQYSQLSEKNKIQYLLSRTPQILQIRNNKPEIIRSKLNNTLIHQPRVLT
jgi:hypothetical protein